ncbi:MAG: hypothetical protein N2441_09755 [Rhodocyclaceae bacterium]|nr:hypothetical protein [Rhodocyclaceae bacterium]
MTMRRFVSFALMAALLTASSVSFAHDWRHRDTYRPPSPMFSERPPHHLHHPPGHWQRWAWGTAAGLALGSVVISLSTPKPPPVVISPLVASPPPPPPTRYWYYCEPYRAYYPTVATCPTPWIAVPAY